MPTSFQAIKECSKAAAARVIGHDHLGNPYRRRHAARTNPTTGNRALLRLTIPHAHGTYTRLVHGQIGR
jgi:hypothetical protein